jgi:hypothetical protein
MADKLVFDLSQETEGAANIFIKKDWVNILDNMNGNYSSNQSVIDTSSISNSNKYASYREAYLLMPLLLTVASTTPDSNTAFPPAAAGTSADYSIGLKNWFGSMIHSMTLDLQGSTIIQQTAFSNMWNSFKLMTSLSWEDVKTIGSTIGFYPDDALSWSYSTVDGTHGRGVCNTTNFTPAGAGALQTVVSAAFNSYKSRAGNEGFLKRQQFINYDVDGDVDAGEGALTYANLLTAQGSINVWKSYVSRKRTGVNGGDCGLYQVSISAIIYLRHLHSFFNYMPLLKGIYMRLTLNLNNSSVAFTCTGLATTAYALNAVSNSVGGVVPIMLASKDTSNGGAVAFGATTFRANVSVGAVCLDTQITSLTNGNVQGTLARSIYLYVPLYSFNPVFESAYLSSPVKTIKYEDLYQYQITNIAAGAQINSLVSNGISDVRSVLCLPYFSASTNAVLTGGGFLPAYQSPFDPAGCGPTSPLCFLNNFNVVVSGQNAIYNSIRYTGWELFSQQVLGANSVNGGLIDGLTSSLIGQQDWEMEYCYHYVDVSRMLDVERAVPKSISITGQNQSAQTIDLMVFVSYGQTVAIDALSGARV